MERGKYHRRLAIWLLPLIAHGVVLACGRAQSRGNDSESHFLVTCDNECPGGSSCICGVCTRECADALDCSGLATSVSCRALEAAECGAGAPALRACDVDCADDEDCAELGAAHRCVSGACRSESSGIPLRRLESDADLEQPLPTDEPPLTPGGTDEDVPEPESPSAGGPAPDPEFFPLPAGATCQDLLNGPVSEPLTVRVRNERSAPIYLERHQSIPFNCFDEGQLVRIQRGAEDVQVREDTRCLLECEAYVAEPGRYDTPACVMPGCQIREVFALDPGAELTESFDREWRQFRLFLPPECLGDVPMDPVTNGGSCLRYGPLAEGEYTLSAKAFTDFIDGGEGSCGPPAQYDPSVPCYVGVEGTEITAQVTTSTPRGEIEVVFTE